LPVFNIIIIDHFKYDENKLFNKYEILLYFNTQL